jgi:serine/threonine protein kinase
MSDKRDKSENKKPKASNIGEYQLTGLILGKGSYSTVREAIETNSNRKVALKIINLETDSYVKRNYKREAYILSKLCHENIIRMFEYLESPKRFIIALELIPENMCDFIRGQKRGKLDETFARVLFRQIIAAIIYIHEKGIIHRDIKLENLLIDTKRNKIKLTGNY